MRSSGILMHITSLPSDYGIGTLGKSAYEFVDFLKAAGQKNWQILPIGPTSYGDSPYQSFSSFAGNPYFIDLDILAEENLLSRNDYDLKWFEVEDKVDYERLFNERYKILRLAYENSKKYKNEELQEFIDNNLDWLLNYAIFMAIKKHFRGIEWLKWDEKIKMRDSQTLCEFTKKYSDEAGFWIFLQYHFFRQWNNLKRYANENRISIIGDIPIYAALDSADTWANPEVFMLDEEKKPIKVAGCPPDAFCLTGQLWGNPIYDWNYLKSTDYLWWRKRIKTISRLFDSVRIDHFRGFDSFYAVPYGHKTAEFGEWLKGPGIDFFNAVKSEFGSTKVIAEDLGFITDSVRKLLCDTGYPGMKVLQFAFDASNENEFLPYNYTRNCVAYTGTHDNDTVMGWFETAPSRDVEHSKEYFEMETEDSWKFIRGIWSSTADLAIAPIQDFLRLGSEARMNTPSSLGGNWCFRVKKEMLTDELASRIHEITALYGR